MCKKFVYLFLVFGFSVAAAQGTFTVAPISTWTITGDCGGVVELDGYRPFPTGEFDNPLIYGTTTFYDDLGAPMVGPSATELAAGADDFSLYTAACADGVAYVDTMFDGGSRDYAPGTQPTGPVMLVFVLEKNGNDSGIAQGLDAAGNPIGDVANFVGGTSYAATGYYASFDRGGWPAGQVGNQQAYGMVFTSDILIHGIRITAPGVDPVSIMGAIPEPATIALLGLGGLALLRRKR